MQKMTMDGNTAAAYISYAFSSLAVIYPITPSSPMAELVDEWQAKAKKNAFGNVPKVVQMQSEAGVAGALHGALTCGALATTYTCSQGLLLMQPDMFKIAGELLPTVFHVSARAIATHALSIFGDHQDVMAVRQTGFAMLCASTVQECMDFALTAHIATLQSSVPFLHFFDGFRTSHELNKIDAFEESEIQSFIDNDAIARFQNRALDPASPCARGTAQNPDTYFQNREAGNKHYLALPALVQEIFDKVAQKTGRKYHPFDYYGAQDAQSVLVMMGSGASTAEETVEHLLSRGEKVGLIKVRLYRPFDSQAFCNVLPKTCQKIAVLDRTKEAGAGHEPLCLDVIDALKTSELSHIQVVGGRYGLGLKEFTPACVFAVFKNLENEHPKDNFTVGIRDDITHTSLPLDNTFSIKSDDIISCIFYGLGSDGTVGANKNSVQIIGEQTDKYVQGYFCYDSRKSGGATISHLRFGNRPIRSAYLIENADFIACHNPSYLTRFDMLGKAKQGATFLLNCPWGSLDELENNLPVKVKRQIAEKQLSFFVVDATKIANEVGLSGRTSTIMQAAFFLLNPTLLPYDKAVSLLKAQLTKKFARKGEDIVQKNCQALDRTQNAVQKIDYPDSWSTATHGAPPLALPKDEYFQSFIHPILSLQGDELPVSAFAPDGSVPTGTTRLEKHGMPYLLPMWIKENCIQCNQCSFVCPHACIRPFVIDNNTTAPESFQTKPAVGLQGKGFRVQVSPHDCMGCGVCANTCPAKEKALVMRPATELMPSAGENWEFAMQIKNADTGVFKRTSVKGSQFYKPLFEFSYACSGCGETPYIKLLTQLFGEKMLIANATGCSSIYGGSSPTCPYTKNENGQGPAWANSLFEDNAEFGLGMRLACEVGDKKDRSVWIIGGDGWAYDIGYGGLDHVLASGANVNVLVLDSEVYSNTGGQVSKATPLGATARFAVLGKDRNKKNLGLMAMTYGYVYVAQVSMGANKQQLINALTEAESYEGPSLVIAYSPCISHGVHMSKSMDEEKKAVESGYFPLYRFHPEKEKKLTLDSPPPTLPLRDFLMGENRFASLLKSNPARAETLFAQAESDCKTRYAFLQQLATLV